MGNLRFWVEQNEVYDNLTLFVLSTGADNKRAYTFLIK